jgi:nitrogen-specific signal transduction histidine kinase
MRVFDPFYRRPGEHAEGSGLGLTIAREIAAAHGGRVGVWCEAGRIEFFVDLRKVAPVPDAAVTAQSGV